MFYDKYCELCKLKGITPTRAASEIGIGMGTPTTWKKRGTYPNPAQAKKVAQYFNVSIDWLMDNEIEKQPADGELSDEEKAMLDLFRRASEDSRRLALLALEHGEQH